MNQNNFISRGFSKFNDFDFYSKDNRRDENKIFENLIHESKISIILGEIGSGKTYQLKNYHEKHKETSKYVELVALDYEDVITHNIKVVLLDSIDEALYHNPSDKILKKKISKYISKCIEVNQDVVFVITCQYRKWKTELYEEEFTKIYPTESNIMRRYVFDKLKKEDIYRIVKNQVKYDDPDPDIEKDVLEKEIKKKQYLFWSFIEKNYLYSDNILHIQNLKIISSLIYDFLYPHTKFSYEELEYYEVYSKLIEEHLLISTDNECSSCLKISLNEMIDVFSQVAYSRFENKISSLEIMDISKISKDISAEKLKMVLDTALFEFIHEDIIQNYLVAYYLKKNNVDILKSCFKENGEVEDKYKEIVVYYFTNQEKEIITEKKLISKNPFIFRKHPFFNREEQEELLSSIIKKLKSEKVLRYNENFFHNSTLIKFDKIDNVFSFIKDIAPKDNNLLATYIMRLFAENYSEDNKEFENFIFQKLNQLSPNKYKCQQYLSYSYNFNYNYNKKLFDFMQKNKLFKVVDKPNKVLSIHPTDKYNPIVENMFLVLYGCKLNSYNTIVKIEKSDFDFKNLIYLLNYIRLEKFQEFTYWFITLNDIEIWIKYLLDNFEDIEKDDYILNKNIAWIVFKILENDSLSQEELLKIISFVQENKISISCQLSICNTFWEIYFSDKIQNFSEVKNFLNFYYIEKSDIQEMHKQYPIEDNLIKTFQLLKFLEEERLETSFFSLEKKQLEKIVNKVKTINNIEENYELISFCMILNYHNKFKLLENLIFKLLEYFVDDEITCNHYIDKSHNLVEYDYSLKLFDFMKKNNLFNQDGVSEGLFSSLYIPNTDTDIEKLLFLFQYISFNFFRKLKDISINDYKQWFDYFSKNYNKKLLESDNYKKCLGWIGYKLLRSSNILEETILEKIILFFIKIEIKIEKEKSGKYYRRINQYLNILYIDEEKTYNIPIEFWSIYFSSKIKNFKEIENFLKSLYDINEKDLKEVIKKYPIEENLEKYYTLGVEYTLIDILMDNKEFQKYIEDKKIEKRKKEKEYQVYIKNVNENNFYTILQFAIKQRDKKIQYDLKKNYSKFIELIINSYSFYSKENNRICDYLFNLATKDDIDKALGTKKNYKKLFRYVILNCLYLQEYQNNLFQIIEEKFDLFLEVASELIDLISKKDCKVTIAYTPSDISEAITNEACQSIINILSKIDFDRQNTAWKDFFEFMKKRKKKDSKYKVFFELICEINDKPYSVDVSLVLIKENNENSFSHFIFLYDNDINIAFESFYKYMYNPSDEEKKKSLFSKLLEFLKKSFFYSNYLDKLDKTYIKKILIDYYKSEKPKDNSSIIDYIFNSMWYKLDIETLKELEKFEIKELSKRAYTILDSKYEEKNRKLIFDEILEKHTNSDKPLIITEGKTDWKHLKKALERFKARGKYPNLDIEFLKYESEVQMGDSELATHVRTLSNLPQSKKHIMIFDRDEINRKKEIKNLFEQNKKNQHFSYQGNKVYSLFIPPINKELIDICIEFYYKQEEVQQAWYKKDTWVNKKRLFYGSEFDKKTQKSKCQKYKTDKPSPQSLDILDGDNKKKVYLIDDEAKKENNIALSKNNFAENIYNDVEGFDNFDIENFRLIFDVIERIIND